ncbi:MAG: hypothetical protein JSU98_06130 [Gemmatimonadales bacterium]|jgi:hypothetical protein|nr:MAG: hypothetical protein JSU98_06130 [Gemmatimonadales bacterium]
MNEQPEQPGSASFLRRVGLLFGAPGALGDALRVRPAWFGVAVLGVALVLTGTLLIPVEVWEESIRAQLMARGQAANTPTLGGELSRIIFAGAGAIMWFVILFVFSGVLTFIFAFILGDEGKYRHYLSAVAHANLIAALGALLVTPLKVAQRDPQLTLSLGTFVENLLPEGFLLYFLRAMDLFALWSWVVLAILISRFDPKRSVGSAAAVVMGMMLLLLGAVAWFQASQLT